MSFSLHYDFALQEEANDLNKVDANQFTFNPVTLADRYDNVAWYGKFIPPDADENWFVDEMEKYNLASYLKLDLRTPENRQIFADKDGFGERWKKKADAEYNEATPPWQIFRDLLIMRSDHAQTHPVYYTFAVEGNHRRLALSCACLGAVATHNQGELRVGSMIDGSLIESKMFHLDTAEDKEQQLKEVLQSLLSGEKDMTTDDNLEDHCLAVSVRYVVDKTAKNEDVLKHLQERSKSISVNKKDSVEQAPFTNVAKFGCDFMLSIPTKDLNATRTERILPNPIPTRLFQKSGYFKSCNDRGEPYSYLHFKQRLKDHPIVFSDTVMNFMGDPFDQRHIDAFKQMFPGFPYSVNMHTLTEEQIHKDNKEKHTVDVNGECVNQLYLAAPIYHILYAAQCGSTTSKIRNKQEVVYDLQYMFLFHFAGNTLNSARYKVDEHYAVVFDSTKRNPSRFDDEKMRAFGACVTTVYIIIALMACSIVSEDPEECHTQRTINATTFKRAFESIESSPKHNFTADCAVLCKCTFFGQLHINDAASH